MLKYLIAVVMLAVGIFMAGCSYQTRTGKSAVTGAQTETVSMGFWDATTFWLWRVPYDRFRFELTVDGDGAAATWHALIVCKGINAGPSLTILSDGVPRIYSGRLVEEMTMAYDLSAEDVRAMAAAKKVTLRVEYGVNHDDATLLDDQLNGVRKLWKKHGVGTAI